MCNAARRQVRLSAPAGKCRWTATHPTCGRRSAVLPRWACRLLGGGNWACPAGLHHSCHCLRQRLKHLPPHVCRQLLQASAPAWLACMGCQACLRAWQSSTPTHFRCVHMSMVGCQHSACSSRCYDGRHLRRDSAAHRHRSQPCAPNVYTIIKRQQTIPEPSLPHLAAAHPQPPHCCPVVLCSACGLSALHTQALLPEHHSAEVYSL